MADLWLVIGESGFNVDFTVHDENGVMDISDFDDVALFIKTSDFVTTSLTDKALTQPGATGVARWAVLAGEVPTTAGSYFGQIILTDTGTTIRKTMLLDIQVETNLG